MRAMTVGYDPRSFCLGGRKARAIRYLNHLISRRLSKTSGHPTGCPCYDCEMVRRYNIDLVRIRNPFSQERYHAQGTYQVLDTHRVNEALREACKVRDRKAADHSSRSVQGIPRVQRRRNAIA